MQVVPSTCLHTAEGQHSSSICAVELRGCIVISPCGLYICCVHAHIRGSWHTRPHGRDNSSNIHSTVALACVYLRCPCALFVESTTHCNNGDCNQLLCMQDRTLTKQFGSPRQHPIERVAERVFALLHISRPRHLATLAVTAPAFGEALHRHCQTICGGRNLAFMHQRS